MTVPVELPVGKQFQYALTNAINNPESVKPTESFTITTSELETKSENIILIAKSGYMEKFTLNTVSPVVGASTTLEVRWRGEHSIPARGYIFIEFPIWNPETTLESQKKTYIQGNERCSPL